MEYRLHIDIPLGGDEDSAIRKAKALLDWWATSDAAKTDLKNIGVSEVNYRIGHDSDRQRSNYLLKNDNGHVNNKKCRLVLDLT